MVLPPDFWESRFQAGRTPWERAGLHPAFNNWLTSGVLTPSRILVPGAGRSPEPEALLDAGFDVVTLDLAESAVADQAQRLGPSRSMLGDVTQWLPDTPFDAVYDQTCLCALPPGLWPAYAAQLRRWLRPGGSLFILFMQIDRPSGPPFNCPIPAMRTLFADWHWGELAPGVPHDLGGMELPAILTAPDK